MSGRRVVVTGVGVISALGQGRAAFGDALLHGRPGIRPMEIVDRDKLSFPNAAEVQDFDPAAIFTDGEDKMLDRFAQFAHFAAREAIEDSGLSWDDGLRARTAVITGSCVGGQTTMDDSFQRLYIEGRKRLHPHNIPRIMMNAGASGISMSWGFCGPAFTVSTACSSANHALGLAYGMIRDGAADVAVSGGSEAPFSLGNLKAWDALRVVSPDTCRPFCKDRKGMILGEGGAMLILESMDAAVERGAKIYGEIAGFGMTADAHHLTRASADGPVRAMQQALESGGLSPEEVGYVNAHGTGTPGNDPNEARAIRDVFGDRTDALPVSSTKSMHGHTLGAAGALEAAAVLLGMKEGFIPPTANFTEPDPECPLDIVANEARRERFGAALSNSFAFGGLNAVVAFRAVDEENATR